LARAIPRSALGLPLADARQMAASVVAGLGSEAPVLLALAIVGLVSHGLNMFQFPSFTGIDDEGIYAAQAWAVLREGQLSPYTYVYDHVPGGWILVAAWMAMTGGPHAFGGAIDSGRALMLLVHVASLLMLYRIARKLGCSVVVAAVGALVFTVSPLALPYQRRLLLDNMMLFWCLLSLDLLLDGWGRLSRVTLSGICFGLAMLTKENAVFLLPPMVYIAWQQRWQHQGRFALFGWLVPLVVVVSWYPLYAALKGELLPAGNAVQFSTSGYGNTGVSLIDSLIWQIGRGGGGPFNLDNQFWVLVRSDWLQKDATLLIAGTLATLVNLARGVRWRRIADRRALATGLLGLLPMLYLARGGIVFDFYVLIALPFLCLNLAVAAEPLLRRLHPRPRAAALIGLGCMVVLVGGYLFAGTLQPLYRLTASGAGREAVAWIKTNVPSDSFILTRDDLWVDLREPGLGGAGFPNIQSYTKVAGDPAIRNGVFGDDWRNVDYLVTSPGLAQTLADSNNTIALDALQHAHQVKNWTSDGSALEVWKVDKPGPTEATLLTASATYLEQRFERDGAFVAQDGGVTSEAEAYALLRSAWSGDRAAFEREWRWTQTHLLNADGLLSWQWRSVVLDDHSAADADADAALALLMAGQRWDNADWRAAGTSLAGAIWDHEVTSVDGRPYLAAGNWAPGLDVVAINPSYFAPYAYHVFQRFDPDPSHDWLGVVDSGYQVLFDASAASLDADHSAGLPPDWLGIDRASGALLPLAVDGAYTTDYGYDAPRTYWRLALDLKWNGDGRAAAFLGQAGFLRDEVQRSGAVRAAYSHSGEVRLDQPSVVGSAGALAALLTLDPTAASSLYAGQVLGTTQHLPDGAAYWGDPGDLYAQEWGWFATALYADDLADLSRT
jgi:endo-1,4-beta-D-glucanase Y/4-amino-4-deoxy-L-arabinose transferase-like glycosyltransferase